MPALRILVQGASVAGPMSALWLARRGHEVTVVERMPLSRVRTSGHAVDLFGPALDVVEWAGVLPEVLRARTQTVSVSFERADGHGPVLEMARLVGGISSRHVEVMRGELAAALHEATRDDVRYLFEDSVSAVRPTPAGVEVELDGGLAERFDVVLGADGLHSGVRRLCWGDVDALRPLGGYLAIFVVPDFLRLGRRMRVHTEPGRMAAVYPVRQSGLARGGFLFRHDRELLADHRDTAAQKRLLRELYGADGWETPRLLDEMDASDDFYFDSISQVVTDDWVRGRVGLVGDAAYSPGPAVGGGTSLAVVGAYVLAQQLDRAGDDVAAGLRAYQEQLRARALTFRRIGPSTLGSLVPRSRLGVLATPYLLQAVSHLPGPVVRRLGNLQATPAKALATMELERPTASAP